MDGPLFRTFFLVKNNISLLLLFANRQQQLHSMRDVQNNNIKPPLSPVQNQNSRLVAPDAPKKVRTCRRCHTKHTTVRCTQCQQNVFMHDDPAIPCSLNK
jgi:uncharacterized paraquat-inducible protein A